MASQTSFVSSDGSINLADVMTWQDVLPGRASESAGSALVIELTDGSSFVIWNALEGVAFRQRMDSYLDATYAHLGAMS